MPRRSWAFVVVVVAGATTCMLWLGQREPWVLERAAVWGLLSFVGVGVLSEALAFDFNVGASKAAKSSISYIPLFAAVLNFAPAWAVIAGASTSLLSDVVVRKRRAWVCLFNASQYILTLTASVTCYRALGGGPLAKTSLHVPAFFAMAFTYFVVNMTVVALFLAIRTKANPVRVFQEVAGPGGGNILYDLLASPIAIFAAWLYDRLYVGGLVVAILPLLLVRYTYLSAVQLRQSNKDLLRVLIKAIETRDPYTSGHSVRVSTLARAIAQDLGLSRRVVERIETAALLHDIGKIEALYAAIISKPHELTASERALIKTHATKGADMLLELSAFKDDEIIGGVRHHHERYDGTGYPDGLKAKAIPLAARIIMICDSLDAMLSDRPYRSALDEDHVRRELIRYSGIQFDPDIVKVIIERGSVERARELVRQQPPDAMEYLGRPVAAYGS